MGIRGAEKLQRNVALISHSKSPVSLLVEGGLASNSPGLGQATSLLWTLLYALNGLELIERTNFEPLFGIFQYFRSKALFLVNLTSFYTRSFYPEGLHCKVALSTHSEPFTTIHNKM